MMNNLIRALIAIPALLFVGMGLCWVFNPSFVANILKMPVLDGVGLSSQIGDLGALFFTMGFMMLVALKTLRKSWFYASGFMLAIIAIFRILAWLLHGAALALEMIAVEVIVAVLLFFGSTILSAKD